MMNILYLPQISEIHVFGYSNKLPRRAIQVYWSTEGTQELFCARGGGVSVLVWMVKGLEYEEYWPPAQTFDVELMEALFVTV